MMQTNTMPAPGAATVLCHREEADNYDRVVLRLTDDIRLIECKDAFQWIVQHRAGERMGTARWRNIRYHRTRSTLPEACRRSGVVLTASQMAIIAKLPTICGRS